jgi:hypothetical protein
MSTVQNVVDVELKVKKPRGRKPAAEPKDQASVPVVDSKAKKSSDDAISSDESKSGDEAKEKKPRKPSLPAKFAKFIQFGLFLMKELNDEKIVAGEAPAVDEDTMIEKIRVFADIDAQKDFVQKFFDGSKDIAKSMRKMIADKKKADEKANKPVKVRKPRAKKNDDGVVDVIPDADTKPKKSKAKAKDGDLVAELVSLAKNDAGDETKTKRKYNRKPKNVEPVSAVAVAEPELEVDVVEIDGKQYLVDDQKRVFDFESHALLGSLSPLGTIL